MFKVTIKPESAAVSKLHSSTLFGALCWSISNTFGSDKLEELLETDTIPITSAAFPSGYLPFPGNSKKLLSIETGEVRNTDEFLQYQSHQHCEISRDTKTSTRHWVSTEYWYTSNLTFYIQNQNNDFDLDTMKKLVENMLDTGLGAGKTRGNGRFTLVDITEDDRPDEIDPADKCTGYVVIADYIPGKSDSTLGKYTARVFRGKTVDGEDKKPLVMVTPGSAFKRKVTDRTVGQLIKDDNTGTYINGKAIIIPIDYDKYIG